MVTKCNAMVAKTKVDPIVENFFQQKRNYFD